MKKNILYVDQGYENPALYADHLEASDLSFITGLDYGETFHATAKFRYRQQDVGVTVNIKDDGKVSVDFDNPVRAITPGQEVVFYDGEECLGGATIDNAYMNAKKLQYI
jgi:tRNA-specific 2-thiouridylase